MNKVVLPIVFAIFMSVLLGAQGAYAAPDCTTGGVKETLLNNELYVGDSTSQLNKVDTNDAKSCVVGTMTSSGTPILCTDVALDPTTTPATLYCVTFTDLYKINRATAAATFVGNLKNGIIFETNVNAMEIDSAGVAYLADVDGNLYNVNLANGALTLRSNLGHVSSGDLAWDVTTGKMYWTSLACPSGCVAGDDGLWVIDLTTNVATFVKTTKHPHVYAADFLPFETTMNFVDEAGALFELTKTGTQIGSDMTTVDIVDGTPVFAYGGTANQLLVGGIKLAINTSALLLGGIQSNAVWLTPGVLAGIVLVAFTVRKKI